MSSDGENMTRVAAESQWEDFQFKRLLVAIDFSDNSLRAAKAAGDLAAKCGAELTMLHVVEKMTRSLVPTTSFRREHYEQEDREARQWMEQASRRHGFDKVQPSYDVSMGESVAKEIVEYASKKNYDLIVVGSRGRGSFKQIALGSVSAGILAQANCPVLVIK